MNQSINNERTNEWMNTIAVISFFASWEELPLWTCRRRNNLLNKKRNACDILAFSYFTSISQTRRDRRLRIATGFRGFKYLSGFFWKIKIGWKTAEICPTEGDTLVCSLIVNIGVKKQLKIHFFEKRKEILH